MGRRGGTQARHVRASLPGWWRVRHGDSRQRRAKLSFEDKCVTQSNCVTRGQVRYAVQLRNEGGCSPTAERGGRGTGILPVNPGPYPSHQETWAGCPCHGERWLPASRGVSSGQQHFPPRYAVGLRNALVLAALLPATARAESFAFAALWGACTGVEGAVDLLGDGHVAIRRRRTAPRHDDEMDGSRHGMSSERGGRWAGVAIRGIEERSSASKTSALRSPTA